MTAHLECDGASIPTLLEYLGHADASYRCDAACALGDRLRCQEIVAFDAPVQEKLATLLHDAMWGVRLEAAIALAEAHDTRATDTLLEASSIRAFRLDATRALGTLGDRAACVPLTRMMRHWLYPWADRLQAAAALCALEDAAGAAYLVAKLSSRRRPERAAAIHFLGESRHPDACTLLSRIVQDADDPMRDVAARSLGLLRDAGGRAALQSALVNADADLCHDIYESLAKLATL